MYHCVMSQLKFLIDSLFKNYHSDKGQLQLKEHYRCSHKNAIVSSNMPLTR